MYLLDDQSTEADMVCPLIDCEESRCAEHLKLDNIDYAVAVCGNDFTQCPVFWDVMTRLRDESAAKRPSAA